MSYRFVADQTRWLSEHSDRLDVQQNFCCRQGRQVVTASDSRSYSSDALLTTLPCTGQTSNIRSERQLPGSRRTYKCTGWSKKAVPQL